ncbi:MAG: hypothetical protein L0K22_10540, partial [Lacticaseibacillus paracasei]|nr:hypothetical protein [Lacticaseibacillus paracasei]
HATDSWIDSNERQGMLIRCYSTSSVSDKSELASRRFRLVAARPTFCMLSKKQSSKVASVWPL